ncbi:MAG TPA: paraquat-inducible protein A [Opitutaceae bacterium]|nr:paraquat-inducible protein A [Opitutaceae bacterium]
MIGTDTLIGCRYCGLVQQAPATQARGSVHCRRCDGLLEKQKRPGNQAALALSIATLLLLFPANLLPMLRVDILGHTNRSLIFSGVAGFWRQDWPIVACIVGLELILLPFLRFGLLVAVLASARCGVRAAWMGPAFRWSEMLDRWALLDVFLFGAVIGYARVAPFFPVRIEAGGDCVVAVAVLTVIVRAALQRGEVWRQIGSTAGGGEAKLIACPACELPVDAAEEGRRCPRCRAKVWSYRPYSAMRAMALTLAAIALFPAAYAYPMQYSERLNTMVGYSIMTGVTELVHAHLWYFAAVIFLFSVVTPLLKLVAMAWFFISIHRRSSARLRFKARLYRLLHGIGRWSHIDVFIVSVFLPLMEFRGFLSVIVGWALPAFLGVVVLTTLGTEVFDPRMLWRFDSRA